jgi:hypothetical protein
LRSRPFRDLLALLTAATKHVELAEISPTQRDVLRQAFMDLSALFLDDNVVQGHIERCADEELDSVASPLRAPAGKRLKISIVEAD